MQRIRDATEIRSRASNLRGGAGIGRPRKIDNDS